MCAMKYPQRCYMSYCRQCVLMLTLYYIIIIFQLHNCMQSHLALSLMFYISCPLNILYSYDNNSLSFVCTLKLTFMH